MMPPVPLIAFWAVNHLRPPYFIFHSVWVIPLVLPNTRNQEYRWIGSLN